MKSLNNNKYTLACVICLLIAIISIIYVSNVVLTLKSELALKEHNEKFFVNFDKEQFSVLKNSHYFDKKETKDNSEQLKEIGPIPEESLFLLLMEKEREYMGIGNLIWQWEVELFIIQKKFLRDI